MKYYDIVFVDEGKAIRSNDQAYRLLVSKMDEEGISAISSSPGVTEAGDGEDGRIKSSVGIGTLLEDAWRYRACFPDGKSPKLKFQCVNRLSTGIKTGCRTIPFRRSGIIQSIVCLFQEDDARGWNIGGIRFRGVIADFSTKEKVTQASLFAWDTITPFRWINGRHGHGLRLCFSQRTRCRFEIPGTLGLIYITKQVA